MLPFPLILLRLCLALVLGALVGFERETKEHSAGMRTNALVALGSALFTIISAYGFASLLGTLHIQVDPTRIASYVVAGIGFLGGGSIVVARDSDKVKGLTTAAAIWVVAAIGMACGAGLLLEAVTVTALALIILVFLHLIERRLLSPYLTHASHLSIETTSTPASLLDQVYTACTRAGISVGALKIRTDQEVHTIEVTCHMADAQTLPHVVGELHQLPGVRTVHAEMPVLDKPL